VSAYGSTSAAACTACPSGTYTLGGASACVGCIAGTFSEVVGSGSVADCQPCEIGKVSVVGSPSCTTCELLDPTVWYRGTGCAVTTSGIKDAVQTNGYGIDWKETVIIWQSGTGTLIQCTRELGFSTTVSANSPDIEGGWNSIKCSLQCTDVVEKCTIDAQGSSSEQRRVLDMGSSGVVLTGLVIRGGYHVSV
jgi:hypothetical protein